MVWDPSAGVSQPVFVGPPSKCNKTYLIFGEVIFRWVFTLDAAVVRVWRIPMEMICQKKTEQFDCNCSKLWPLSNSPEDTACFSRRAIVVMAEVNERWSEQNRPFAFRQAFAVLLAHFAAMRSHDVARLHRTSGFPLKFVSLLVFELLRSPLWLSSEGYADLVSIIESQQGVTAFDIVLGEMINRLFGHETDSALEVEWNRAMGVDIKI
jgi:hypothetical protein